MSHNPEQQNPQKSVESFIPYELSFGAVHGILGFKGVDRTVNFLQYLLRHDRISVRVVKKDQQNLDESRVMKTQELPKKLRNSKRIRANYTPEEKKKIIHDLAMIASFLEREGEYLFNQEEICTVKPLAKTIQEKNMTMEEYFKNEAMILAKWREESQKPGVLQKMFRSCLFFGVLAGAAGGGALALNFPDQRDRLIDQLKEWKDEASAYFPESSPALPEASSENPDTSSPSTSTSADPAPSTSEVPSGVQAVTSNNLVETEGEIELKRKQEIEQLFKRGEEILNPEQITLASCEEMIQALGSQSTDPQAEQRLGELTEQRNMLRLLEKFRTLLDRLERREGVTSSEIDTLLNPGQLTEEGLLEMKEQWESPEVQNAPQRDRNLRRIRDHLLLLSLAQDIKKLL